MTPFKIADDPPTPQPIPDLVHPEKTPAERAAARFSLAGKKAIGACPHPPPTPARLSRRPPQ